MKNPQTTAMIISKHIKEVADYGCLAFCYLYACGIDTDDDTEIIKMVCHAIDERILDANCYVYNAEKFINWFTGRNATVVKKNITKIDDIKEPTPVCYDYKGARHWVVVENGKIAFNSLINSTCVSKGKPTEARIIKLGIIK